MKATKNGASVVLEGATCGPFPYAGMIRFRFQGFFSGCIPFFGGTATPNGHQQDSRRHGKCQQVRLFKTAAGWETPYCAASIPG